MESPIPVLHPITRLIVGGAQENTMYTAALLDKSRYDVEIISGPQTGSEGSLIGTVREHDVHLEILPELVREISLWKDILSLWKLFLKIKQGGFTIVHTHSSKAGLLGRIAARLAGVPVIVHTVHGWSFHVRMSPLRRWLYAASERWVAQFTDRLIVVAKEDIQKGLIYKIGNEEKYRLIRSAIPLDEFNPKRTDRDKIRRELGIPQDAPVLGNVGRLSPQKNPLDWVRVAAKVADQIPDCKFLLVGDGPLRKEVESLISDLGISDRTILTGLRRDIPQMLAAMDVFLLTSLWEGLPRVIPQALAMRIPVVASRADGTIEAIEHGKTGYLYQSGEIDQTVAYCVSLLQNSGLRNEMGIYGRKFALEEFDINVMIEKIDGLYQELLERKGRKVS